KKPPPQCSSAKTEFTLIENLPGIRTQGPSFEHKEFFVLFDTPPDDSGDDDVTPLTSQPEDVSYDSSSCFFISQSV
ncbi:hypothetical protein, partial [Salmonella enterica]|uniref:hypothetical protein n=1 Tax=Salmonella enterica TaxID=28901 RepID=UPI001F348606